MTQPPPIESDLARRYQWESVPAGRRTRAALMDLGVGNSARGKGAYGWLPDSGLPARYLEDLSRGKVMRATWLRLVGAVEDGQGYLCTPAKFIAVLETLKDAGIPNSILEKLEQCYETDKRVKDPTFRLDRVKDGAAAAEISVSMLRRLPDAGQRRQFQAHFVAGLTMQERLDLIAELASAPPTWGERDGHDGDGSRDGDGSSAG